MYFVLRSLICLGKTQEVLDEISRSPTKTAELSAIQILAQFFASPENRSAAVQAISQLLNEELCNTPLVRIIACTIYNNVNDYEHAYLVVRNADNIEELSVLVYTLVRMNRVDKAAPVYNQMCKIDEDHVLTQLAKTWMNSNGVGSRRASHG